MYLDTILMVCDKSGLVHAIAYIRIHTTLEYRTWDIYSRSSIVFGDILAESLKWGAKKVLTDFIHTQHRTSVEHSTSMLYKSNSLSSSPCLSQSPYAVSSSLLPDPSFSNSEESRIFNLSIDDLLVEAYHLCIRVDRYIHHLVACKNKRMGHINSWCMHSQS